MKVQLFIPCFIDQMFPKTAFNMEKVLKKAGCQISYNSNQTCCGQPAFNAGYWDDCIPVAKKFLSDFNDFDYIVAPSGSCTGFVRNYYQKLLENCQPPLNKRPVKKQFYELSEFMTEILNVDDVGARFEGVAAYHECMRSFAGMRDSGCSKENVI